MADLSLANSAYATGGTDTWTSQVNNVSLYDAQHVNGLASAILQLEAALGSGSSLPGSLSSLAARLAVQVGADGIIIPPGMGADYFGSSAPTGWLFRDGSAVSRTTFSRLYAAIGNTWGAGDGSTTFNLPDDRSRVTVGAGTGVFVATAAAANVDAGANTITTQSNVSLYHGTPVVYTTSGSVIGGLTASTTYYAIRTSATVIQLATSAANALAGTAIDLTSQGSGTHTFTITYTTRSLGEKGGEEAHAMTAAENGPHNHTTGAYNKALQDGPGGSEIGDGNGTGPDVNSSGTLQASGAGTPHNNMMTFLVCNKIIKT